MRATTIATTTGPCGRCGVSSPRRSPRPSRRRSPLGRRSRSGGTDRGRRWGAGAALIGPLRRLAGEADSGGGLGLAGQQAFALRALARQLARPADRFRSLPCLLLGWFFVVGAEPHLAENPLALR